MSRAPGRGRRTLTADVGRSRHQPLLARTPSDMEPAHRGCLV